MAKINEDFYIGDTGIDLAKVANSAIVEQGSNANGHYIKWENGLMICWFYKRLYNFNLNTVYTTGHYIGNYDWTYPVPFVRITPCVTCTHFQFSSGATWAGIRSIGVNSCRIVGHDTVSRTGSDTIPVDISATAIGYWK